MSWIQRAKPGDKVVCINANTSMPDGVIAIDAIALPSVGAIYTIELIEVGEVIKEVGISLVEIGKQRVDILIAGVRWSGCVLFDPDDFRPVEPRKTDITFANEILRKASKPIKEFV